MEYMREEVDVKASITTSSSAIPEDTTELEEPEMSTKVAAWQEEGQNQGKAGCWAERIKTFGTKHHYTLETAAYCWHHFFRDEGFAWSSPRCWIDLCIHGCCLLPWLKFYPRSFDI